MCIVDFDKIVVVYFARSDAFKGTFKETFIEVKSMVFFVVLCVWEKFVEGL